MQLILKGKVGLDYVKTMLQYILQYTVPDQILNTVTGHQIRVWNWKLFFLLLNQNICCGYSKEPSRWDGSCEHLKHMFKLMDKKIITIYAKFFSSLALYCYPLCTWIYCHWSPQPTDRLYPLKGNLAIFQNSSEMICHSNQIRLK